MPVPREVHPASRGVHRDGYHHPDREGVGIGIGYRGDDTIRQSVIHRIREAHLRGPRKLASRAVRSAFRFPSPARARAAIIGPPSPRPLPPRDPQTLAHRLAARPHRGVRRVPITHKDFTAVPLREMNLLWHNTSTNLTEDEQEVAHKAGAPRVMSIAIEGVPETKAGV